VDNWKVSQLSDITNQLSGTRPRTPACSTSSASTLGAQPSPATPFGIGGVLNSCPTPPSLRRQTQVSSFQISEVSRLRPLVWRAGGPYPSAEETWTDECSACLSVFSDRRSSEQGCLRLTLKSPPLRHTHSETHLGSLEPSRRSASTLSVVRCALCELCGDPSTCMPRDSTEPGLIRAQHKVDDGAITKRSRVRTNERRTRTDAGVNEAR
jgi:hypothetical protein